MPQLPQPNTGSEATIGKDISAAVGNPLKNLSKGLTSISDALKPGFQSIINANKSLAKDVVNLGKITLQGTKWLGEKFKDGFSSIKSTFSNAFGSLQSHVMTAFDSSPLAQSIYNVASSVGKWALGWAKGFIKKRVENLKEWNAKRKAQKEAREEQQKQTKLLEGIKKQGKTPAQLEEERMEGKKKPKVAGFFAQAAEDSVKALADMFMAPLKLILVAIAAFWKEFLVHFKVNMKSVSAIYEKGFKAIKNFLKKFKWSAKIIKALEQLTFTLRFNLLLLGEKIQKAIKSFKLTFTFIAGAPSRLGKFFKFIMKGVEGILKLFSKIGNFFKSFATSSSSLFGKIPGFDKALQIVKTFAGKFGMILGKLFFPLTIIMAAYEAIKGAIAGFKKDGIIGGLLGAISGLFTFFVDEPLNLLKDIVSWLLEKFGFTEASQTLDAFTFNFGDWFYNGMMFIVNGVKTFFTETIPNIWNGIVEEISKVWELVSSGFSLISDFFSERIANGKKNIENIFSFIIDKFLAFGDWMLNAFDIDWGNLLATLIKPFGAVGGWLSEQWESLTGSGGPNITETRGGGARNAAMEAAEAEKTALHAQMTGYGSVQPSGTNINQFNNSQTTQPIISRTRTIDVPGELVADW